jgi:signal transduction histidine kinase
VTLGRQMWLASIALAIVVASAFAALAVALTSQRDAAEREARSRDVVAAALRLEKLVVDVELGVRGYAITGAPALLEPYESARRRLPGRILELRRAVGNDRTQRTRAAQLAQAINQYVVEYAEVIVGLVPSEPEAARSSEAEGEGAIRTADIRARFEKFYAAEEELTQEAASSASTRADTALAVAGIGFAGSTLLIVLFAAALSGSIVRPIRAVAAGAGSLAEGDLSVRLPPGGPGEVGELTRSFNMMAERLEESRAELQAQNEKLRESERMKTELVSIVSHELRTPLASVLGFTSLLLKRDFDPPTRRHYLGIVDAQARRLAALLEDFLDVQRIERAGLELADQKVDLARVLEEQAELFAAQSPSHRLEVEVERPLPVRGDPNRLAQVVGNLLSNAIKYSEEGSRVALAAEKDGYRVRMTVRDEGRGIPAEQQERIFTKFFRGDAGATGITGTGLGLAVSREIVEAHGGRIGFDSDAGSGSTFWVELPAARGEATATERGEER